MNRSDAKYYKAVYFGSCKPEYNLYDINQKYCGFWSEYHDGPLPTHIKRLPDA